MVVYQQSILHSNHRPRWPRLTYLQALGKDAYFPLLVASRHGLHNEEINQQSTVLHYMANRETIRYHATQQIISTTMHPKFVYVSVVKKRN